MNPVRANQYGPSIFYEAETKAITNQRGRVVTPAMPRRVRLIGPVGGRFVTTDPEALEREARALMDAAAFLRAAPVDPNQPELFTTENA